MGQRAWVLGSQLRPTSQKKKKNLSRNNHRTSSIDTSCSICLLVVQVFVLNIPNQMILCTIPGKCTENFGKILSSYLICHFLAEHVLTEQCRCGRVTKVSDHVRFVTQRSTDKIGDLSTDNP